MSKTKSLVTPQLAKLMRENFPIARKRSALWFFNNECRNDLIETSPTSSAILQSPPPKPSDDRDNSQTGASQRKTAQIKPVSRNKILQMWRNMDPESKRKYFNMAEFDDVRFKEQKSLWVSEVGAMLRKNQDVDHIMKMAPTHEDLQNEFLVSLEKLQKKYEQMIQTESTKEIYKEAIKRLDIGSMDADEIISAIPRHHGALLARPRRPPAAFVLYLNDNMARYKEIKRLTRTKENHMQLCAKEWNNLDSETKRIYENQYHKLKADYDKAMEEYKAGIQGTTDTYLLEASREKKAFRRSLRKRLRNSSLLPVAIRNPFNFFLMENRDNKLSDATESWRNLSQEKKLKYYKMNEEDIKRYNREIAAFNEIRQSLDEMVMRRKGDESSDSSNS